MAATVQERTEVVATLAEYFHSDLTPLALEAYLVALEDMEADDLRVALRTALKRSRFMPSGAELLEYAKEARYGRRLLASGEAALRALDAAPVTPEQLEELRALRKAQRS